MNQEVATKITVAPQIEAGALLFRASPDLLLVIDQQHVVVDLNPAAEDFFLRFLRQAVAIR